MADNTPRVEDFIRLACKHMGGQNFIDAYTWSGSPDIRLGVNYILTCYKLKIIFGTKGDMQILHLIYPDDAEKLPLTGDQINILKPDSGALRILQNKLDQNIYPDWYIIAKRDIEYKKKYAQFGFCDREGHILPSKVEKFEDTASDIVYDNQWVKERTAWFNSTTTEEKTNVNFLLQVKGYALIANHDGKHVLIKERPLTKIQANVLHIYFNGIGDIETAQECLNL